MSERSLEKMNLIVIEIIDTLSGALNEYVNENEEKLENNKINLIRISCTAFLLNMMINIATPMATIGENKKVSRDFLNLWKSSFDKSYNEMIEMFFNKIN